MYLLVSEEIKACLRKAVAFHTFLKKSLVAKNYIISTEFLFFFWSFLLFQVYTMFITFSHVNH